MSESGSNETEPGQISDEDLPEDLRPTDDNPLAKNLEDDDATDDDHPAGPPQDATGSSG